MSGEEGPLIAFGKPIEALPLLSDAEYLAGIVWDERAPAKLRRAARSGDPEQVVPLLMATTGGRRKRPAARRSSSPKQALWSCEQVAEPQRFAMLVRAWDVFGRTLDSRHNGHHSNGQSRPKSADFSAWERWARTCLEDPPVSSVELLVLFEILRDEGPHLPGALATKLWRTALTAAVLRTTTDGLADSRSIGSRLLDAELNFEAGLLFSAVSGAERLAASGRHQLNSLLLQSTDSEGVPSAEIIDELPDWLAALVRAREWGQRFARPLFDRSQKKRFRGLVLAIARLCRGDGRLAFSNGKANGLAGLLSAAVAAVPTNRIARSPAFGYLRSLGAQGTVRSLATRSTNGRQAHASNRVSPRNGVKPVFQSDRSRLACLRSNWSPNANSLTVLHHGRLPKLELAACGDVLLDGDWEIEIRVGGAEVPIIGPWSCSCWFSEEEGDYLELQLHLTPEIRIERQLLLTRRDDLLLLADAVIGKGEPRIDYISRLPLVPGLEVLPFSRTRECRVSGPAGPARLFPLGLPCERTIGTGGHFVGSDRPLELRQSGIGGLYAPIAIDWNPARRRSPAVWRSLTVAQSGIALPAGRAAGCRLQIGKAQWLVYRSLSPILEPRTVLGQHTMYETLIGRFDRSGEVEPIVLVEQRAEGAE
jgi:hypothetical protein